MKKIRFVALVNLLLLLQSCGNTENGVEFNVKMTQIENPIESPDILDEPYGICAHITRTGYDYYYIDGILELMDDLNITWVRSDMDWSSVSSEPGNLDYTFFDKMFSHMEKYPNIHLLPIVTYYGNYPNAKNPTLQIKEYYDEWVEYVDGIVSRYSKYCPVWEGFNEWEYWLYNKVFAYDEAVKYQSEIYNIVKKYNQDSSVLLGSMGWGDAFGELTSNGITPYYNTLNLHIYPSFAPESNLISTTSQVADYYMKHVFSKDLWITEFGYSTALGYRTEEEQAYLIPRTFIFGFARGISKMFLYSMRAREYTGSDTDREANFGIVHKDLSPKPAYYSVRNMTRMLPSGSTRPKVYNINTIYVACWVHPTKGKVYAIWNNGESKNIGLAFQGTPHCYSYMDIENELEIGDYGQFEIGPGIIYITGVTNMALK